VQAPRRDQLQTLCETCSGNLRIDLVFLRFLFSDSDPVPVVVLKLVSAWDNFLGNMAVPACTSIALGRLHASPTDTRDASSEFPRAKCFLGHHPKIAITTHNMDDLTNELTERFERYCVTKDDQFPADVLAELQSMSRLYSISPEELDFKWQAYNMKMGGEENKMDLKTARDFKKTIQDALERESRGKAQQRNEVKRGQPTPRAKGGDMYDMYVEQQKDFLHMNIDW
jgi:hypothetical protein